MRALGFTLALAAVTWSCVDFWRATRPALGRCASLRQELRAALDDGTARVRAHGAPPNESEVEAARSMARSLEHERAEVVNAWFAGARRAADYLYPRVARPPPFDPTADRARLEQQLLTMPAELKAYPGVTSARFGLMTPSISGSLSNDSAQMAEQTQRAVAAAFFAVSVQGATPLLIDHATLIRPENGGLVLRVTTRAAIDQAIALFESLTGPTDVAPPRALLRFSIERVPPVEWALASTTLTAPPVRAEIALRFDFPSDGGGAGR